MRGGAGVKDSGVAVRRGVRRSARGMARERVRGGGFALSEGKGARGRVRPG